MTELRLTPSPAASQPPTKASASSLLGKILLGFVATIGSLVATAVVALPLVGRFFEIRGFRTSSNSMCPTICIEERFFASMNAYRHAAPARGDVILHPAPQGEQLFIKRVVGIAGDTVSPGIHNEVLVNGKGLGRPAECGNPSADPQNSQGSPFNAVQVPNGQLFVLGDNLPNSYDSRFFGTIAVDQVRGKPLLVYWSPKTSRIGCAIH